MNEELGLTPIFDIVRAFSWKGVFLGGITDVAATGIIRIPLAIIAVIGSNLTSLPLSTWGTAVVAVIEASPGLRITGWVLGAMCSVLGGYVAARIANRGELINGALSAYFWVGLRAYSIVASYSTTPRWQHLVAFVGSPVLGASGGYLWARRANRMLAATKASVQPM